MARTSSRSTAVCVAVAVLLPPAAILLLIWTRGVNVPYFDEWTLVPFVLKARAGKVTFADIWAQHNEHRIVSVRLIIMLLLPFTRFNVVAQMLAAFAMAMGSLALFWRALQLTVGQVRSDLVPVLMFPLSLLMFSAVHYETWLYSLPALQWQLGSLCAALTVWALARWPGGKWALIVGGGCTAVSMLAVVSGLALWGATVVGVLLLHIHSRRDRFWKVAWLGSAVMVALVMVYFTGFENPRHHPSAISALSSPLSLARFVSAYLGASFALQAGLAVSTTVGAAGLTVSTGIAYLALRASTVARATVAPWLALWAYALAVALVTAVGRVRLAPESALSRHYSAAAVLFWIATLSLAALVWSDWVRRLRESWRKTVVLGAALAVVAAATLYIGAYRYASRELDRHQRNLDLARQELLMFESAPDIVFQYLYPPDPAVVRSYSALLQEARLGPFAELTSKISDERRFSPLAVLEGMADFKGHHDVADCESTAGWAMDWNARDRSVAVDLYDDKRRFATVQATGFRADLLAAGIGTGYYGFSTKIPSQLKDGRPHAIRAGISGTMSELTGTPRIIQCAPKPPGM